MVMAKLSLFAQARQFRGKNLQIAVEHMHFLAIFAPHPLVGD